MKPPPTPVQPPNGSQNVTVALAAMGLTAVTVTAGGVSITAVIPIVVAVFIIVMVVMAVISKVE